MDVETGGSSKTPEGPGAHTPRPPRSPEGLGEPSHLRIQEEIRVDQRSRITGQTAATTSNDMDEALRRVQGRPAPTSTPRTLAVAA